MPRGSVPVERTWGATDVFATVEAWEAELEAVLSDLPELLRFKGRFGEGAAVLAEALRTRDDLARRAGRVCIDTRVLQILYALPEGSPVYVGQQMDVFIESTGGKN